MHVMSSSALRAFTCSLCQAVYRELPFAAVCDRCSKPLNAFYEYESVRVALQERPLSKRPRNIWRLGELLPVVPGDRIGTATGFSPLIRAHRLGRRLGLRGCGSFWRCRLGLGRRGPFGAPIREE